MTTTEVIVVVFGLFVGYWVIAKLIFGGTAGGASTRPGPPWYTVLNVSPGASVDEIRAAHAALAGQYDPAKVAALGPELRALAEAKSREIDRAYADAIGLRGSAS